jgi:hypothetical protein
LPQIKVWKHPRKKTYTENKFIHLQRIKKDACRNFKKRRTQELYAEIIESFNNSTPITLFVDYIKFIDNNKIQIAKLAALNSDRHITRYDASGIVFDFLCSVTAVNVNYDGLLAAGVTLEKSHYYLHTGSNQHVLAMLIPMLIGVAYKGTGLGSCSAAWFGFGKKLRFDDIVELVAEQRLEQEKETILNRLADDGDDQLPARLIATHKITRELKILAMNAVAPFKPLTLDVIGKIVFMFTVQSRSGFILFDEHGIHQGTLVAYTDTQAVVACRGNLIYVDPIHIRYC